jgi:hypothetical protein
VWSLMRRDLGPHLAVSVRPESGETSRIVVCPLTHQRTGMLAATLPFVLVSNHLGLPLSYRTPTHQTNPTSSGYPVGERQCYDRCGSHDCSGQRKRREPAEGDDQAGDRGSRPRGEAHRHLADSFDLWAQPRRDRTRKQRAAANHSEVPSNPKHRQYHHHPQSAARIEDEASDAGADDQQEAASGDGGGTDPVSRPTGDRRGDEHAGHVDANDDPDEAEIVPVRDQVYGDYRHDRDHNQVRRGQDRHGETR